MLSADGEDQQFVPTRTHTIYPESRVEYNTQRNEVRWLLPQYLGFIDQSTISMRCKAQMVGRGWTRPDTCGIHAFTRNLRVVTGDGKTELESISDSNALCAQTWPYTENQSIAHKRDLFEGRSNNEGIHCQLWRGRPLSWRTATLAASVVTNNPNPILQIQAPFSNSGILDGDCVFPVAATQGLRVQQTLENVTRACSLSTNEEGQESEFFFAWTALTAATLDNDAGNDADDWGMKKSAAGSTMKLSICDPAAVTVVGPPQQVVQRGVWKADNVDRLDNNPFVIGDVIYARDAAEAHPEQELGVVRGMFKDANDRLCLKICADRAAGTDGDRDVAKFDHIYFKQADRMKTTNYTAANQGAATDVNLLQFDGADYSLTDLQMVVTQVQPSDAYVSRIEKSVAAGTLAIDYRTSTQYRVNLASTVGLTSQLIPADQRRAYSVYSVPTAQGASQDATASSFHDAATNEANYQYTHRGTLIPDRVVSLRRLSQEPVRVEPLHLMEVEAAIRNTGQNVLRLTPCRHQFMLARAFSRHGQVYDLADGSLTLRVEYKVDGDDEPVVYSHWVNHLRTLIIGAAGAAVTV